MGKAQQRENDCPLLMNPFCLPHLHLPSTGITNFLCGSWETVSPALKSVYNKVVCPESLSEV